MPDPTLTVDELSVPRRVAIATLFQEVLRTERELGTLYGGFAGRAEIPYLRAAFEELADAKRERAAALQSLATTLGANDQGGVAAPEPLGTPPAPVARRSDVFAHAFEGERTLEAAYRELLALVEPAFCPGLAELAAGSARHRALLRDLYLRYS